jgi:hypothetical protein
VLKLQYPNFLFNFINLFDESIRAQNTAQPELTRFSNKLYEVDNAEGYELMIDRNKKELQMEFTVKSDLEHKETKIKPVAKGILTIKAALHNISIIKNNTPFARLDNVEYNMERW